MLDKKFCPFHAEFNKSDTHGEYAVHYLADNNCARLRKQDDQMEKVTGIGGVFFKARDPERMAAWYRENLGIATEDGHADLVWRDNDDPKKIGRTVWSLFPADTDYFGASGQTFMINYRVADLDRMLAQLRQNGVAVLKVEDYDYGRFAWITDPEGNRIELFEPKGE